VTAAVDDLAPRGAAGFGRLHAATFRDATVAAFCRELWRQTSSTDGVADKLSTDTLLFAMIATLTRRARGHVRSRSGS
jgi:hypothetical protein